MVTTCLYGTIVIKHAGDHLADTINTPRRPTQNHTSFRLVCHLIYLIAVRASFSAVNQVFYIETAVPWSALGFDRNSSTEHLIKFVTSEQNSQAVFTVQCLWCFEALSFRKHMLIRWKSAIILEKGEEVRFGWGFVVTTISLLICWLYEICPLKSHFPRGVKWAETMVVVT